MNTLKENIAAAPEVYLFNAKKLRRNSLARAERYVEITQYMVDMAEKSPDKRFRGQDLIYWQAELSLVTLQRDTLLAM